MIPVRYEARLSVSDFRRWVTLLAVSRTCPLCGRDNAAAPSHPYSVAPWVLRQCGGCGLVYLENPPEYASLEEDLAWEKTWAEEVAQRRRREPLLHFASRALKAVPQRLFGRDKLVSWVRRYAAPGRVLDVGCGGGYALERLPAAYLPFGVEVSKELSRRAQQRFALRGGQVVQGDALRALSEFAPEFFSGVVMTSYLEHEPNPRAVLEAAARVMKPGARLIVKVPNFASWNRTVRGARWCGLRFPDHVNYFTPELLVRLLEKSGFGIVRFAWLDRLPTSDSMWLVGEKRTV